ncbi:hypothetical protein J7643_13115 [bacterium]|nr:hypothetical protein [bacterium]
MEETRSTGEIAPAVSARITPEDAQYQDVVQRLFVQNEAPSTTLDHDRLKVNLIANVSHELRTPLSTIVGFGSILDDESIGSLTPLQRDCVRKILEGSETMLRVVSDLLVFSQLEADAYVLHKTMVAPVETIQATLKAMQPVLDAKHQRLEVKLDLPLPALYADGERLVQILSNLLDNASRFTPSGGQIALRCGKEGNDLVIEVADHGIGMAPEHLERIFDRYYQIRDQRLKRTGGTGLGLAIVKRLVELHDGAIAVESAPDRGSRFIVRLPVLRP